MLSRSQTRHLLDHLEQLPDHVADAVLNLVKLPVVHEGRRAGGPDSIENLSLKMTVRGRKHLKV